MTVGTQGSGRQPLNTARADCATLAVLRLGLHCDYGQLLNAVLPASTYGRRVPLGRSTSCPHRPPGQGQANPVCLAGGGEARRCVGNRTASTRTGSSLALGPKIPPTPPLRGTPSAACARPVELSPDHTTTSSWRSRTRRRAKRTCGDRRWRPYLKEEEHGAGARPSAGGMGRPGLHETARSFRRQAAPCRGGRQGPTPPGPCSAPADCHEGLGNWDLRRTLWFRRVR